MASTPTTRIRAMKQGTGDNENTWGVEQNAGTIDQFDRAWGVAAVTVNTTATLSTTDYVDNQASKIVLILSGTGGTLAAPAVDKPYLVINGCSGDVTMTPDGGTGVTIRAGSKVWYYTNAAGDTGFVVDPTLDEVKAAAASLSLNSQKIVDLADPDDPQDAATKNYIDTLAASGDLATVAAIADEIVIVAAIDGEIVVVSAIAADVTTVAGVAADVAQLADMFVGASATDPTTRLDGSPLEAGDYYLNTSGTPTVNVYDGANWVPIGSVTIASQAEAEAGTNNANVMTPLRTAQAIDAQVSPYTQPTALGAVGTYALCQATSTLSPGGTIAGANLEYAGASDGGGATPTSGSPGAGTWRAMGRTFADSSPTVFLRIA